MRLDDLPVPKAVVFDLDGLLFNTEELYQEVGTRVLARRGKEFTQELVNAMMGRPPRVSLQLMIDWHDLKQDTVAILAAESEQVFAEILDSRLEPMPGMLELLTALEQAGIPRGIGTSSNRTFTSGVLSRFQMEPRFQTIVTSDDVAHGKPSPDIYLKASANLGHSPEQVLILEDSQTGCQAALAAGAITVAVPSGHSRHHDFSRVHLVADTLADPRIYELLRIPRC